MRNFRALLCCALLPLSAAAQSASSTYDPSANTAMATSTSPWRSPYTYRGDTAAAIAAPVEISFGYSYLRANKSPGQCGCFSMDGGNAEAAFHAWRWLSAVAELTGERTSAVNGGSQGLSLVSFTAGPRFTYPIHHRYAPFAQALFGIVHGFNSYFPVSEGVTGAANGFAMIAGGGLDVRVRPWLALRPIQAGYFLTGLPNGGNNRQDSLRLSAGLVLRFW